MEAVKKDKVFFRTMYNKIIEIHYDHKENVYYFKVDDLFKVFLTDYASYEPYTCKDFVMRESSTKGSYARYAKFYSTAVVFKLFYLSTDPSLELFKSWYEDVTNDFVEGHKYSAEQDEILEPNFIILDKEEVSQTFEEYWVSVDSSPENQSYGELTI